MLRIFLILLLNTSFTLAKPEESLPDPLTLPLALSLFKRNHQYQIALNYYQETKQALQVTESNTASLVNISSFVGASKADHALADVATDYAATLHAEKLLTDFGYQRYQLKFAKQQIKAAHWQLIEAQNASKLQIMALFFDILLADLEYTRDNEAMAVAFIRLDRNQVRNKLQQISDLTLLALEDHYQSLSLARQLSANKQRISRSKLAITLDFANQLPSQLSAPELTLLPLKSFEALKATTLLHNASINKQLALTLVAQFKAKSALKRYHPTLTASANANTFHRRFNSRDQFNLKLSLNIPIYTGSRRSSNYQLHLIQARKNKQLLTQTKNEIQHQLLTTWLALKSYPSKRKKIISGQDVSDLNLDNSRTLYEQEVNADLGQAMVKQSQVIFDEAKITYQQLLLQAQLQSLLGKIK